MLRDDGVLTAAFYHRRRRRPIDYTNLHGGTYSPRKALHTFKKYVFLKKNSKIFWALFSAPGGLLPPFSNSPPHAHYPHFFPIFHPFLHFLLPGIYLLMIGTHHLLPGLVIILLTSQQGSPTYGPTPSVAPTIFCLTPRPPSKR